MGGGWFLVNSSKLKIEKTFQSAGASVSSSSSGSRQRFAARKPAGVRETAKPPQTRL